MAEGWRSPTNCEVNGCDGPSTYVVDVTVNVPGLGFKAYVFACAEHIEDIRSVSVSGYALAPSRVAVKSAEGQPGS